MKVTVLTNLYPPDILGGYELLARDVVETLERRGHAVDVLTTGDGSEAGRVLRTLCLARRFGRPAGRDRLRHFVAGALNTAAVRRYLRVHGRPDAVLVMSQRRLGLAPLRTLQEAGVPAVVTVNDDWPVAFSAGRNARPRAQLGGLLDELLVPSRTWRGIEPAAVAWLSDAVRRTALAAGVPLGSGVVQPQGVDLSCFTARPFRPMRPEPRLLFVGRLHPSKAPDVAIDALAELEKRGLRATLTLAGAADEPAYLSALRQRARALRVDGRITWAGKLPREQLPALYRDADALLFASKLEHEGQGLTYLEAMACGLPVAASPSGGARDFLERHDASLLVKPCTGEAFAETLTALHRDAAAQEALVQRALDIVRRHASLDAYVRCLEKLLRRAAATAAR
ncbi:glycosyltransferase family 4 protein [Corallococcus aberystwythensis]|uniref:glycosyltransferase family 4 protein n=1 Tax=Corallococcus aberystwythensis TaxID=2316722 RepID=UPI0013155DE6|nr:glycosyltransferase family 4 protein [Corallococcus aberystwythensis]